jgi:hypothetical protein
MRRPTATVRIDLETHDQLADLAELWSERWSMHVSMADVVRMGVSLLYSRINEGSNR